MDEEEDMKDLDEEIPIRALDRVCSRFAILKGSMNSNAYHEGCLILIHCAHLICDECFIQESTQ